MSDPRDTKHRGNPWGPFADDPNSPLLDPVVGEVWDRAVEAARKLRLAAQRTEDAVARMDRERQAERDRARREAGAAPAPGGDEPQNIGG